MQFTKLPIILSIIAALTLSACSQEKHPSKGTKVAPWVKTVALIKADRNDITLSGTVRARYETPVAFQVGGRIAKRLVDAGMQVTAKQPLFSIDPRDLDETQHAAQARLASAEAVLQNAEAKLTRYKQLVSQNFVSKQTIEELELVRREAMSRRDSAKADLLQANNAQGYATLRAPAAGVLMEVSGEPGQVVTPGQTLAVLAQAGEREIEVFLPDGANAPKQGQLQLADGQVVQVVLREVAGAADLASRSWRARYAQQGKDKQLALGSIVQVQLTAQTAHSNQMIVPLGAIDERGDGAHVWQVIEGKATPHDIIVIALDGETAKIQGMLGPSDLVIALGTQFLKPGMAVRELAR